MVWVTQLLIKHKGREAAIAKKNATPVLWKRVLQIHLVLFLIISWAAYKTILNDRSVSDPTAAAVAVDGYKTERVTTEIVKLQNSQSLIYVKNIPGFFSADHHPMICWKGSGYSFKQMQLETIGGQQVYTALLINGKEQLYTSWWYDNGIERTVEQMIWRRKMLVGGRPFSVVNVTAGNKQQLMREIGDIIRSNRLKPLL
jgi:exosortase N